MVRSGHKTARLMAVPLMVAVLSIVPDHAHAAPAPRAAPTLAARSNLLGPLRVVAAFGTATSAWRSVEHNRRIGGVPNSYHLIGQAIDVRRRPGVTHQMVDAALRRAGYLLVESIDEIDHSHFAFLPGGSAPRVLRPEAAPTLASKPGVVAPRVAADLHGSLLIDGESPAAGGPAPSLPPAPAGSAPVLASVK